MISITIKKEDLLNFEGNINICLLENEVESNIVLDAQKLVELPKEKGWKVSKFEKIPSFLLT
tara:strand:- start:78 stop:263 length:186 start_codon:yes stop_codon:yes gene_type:complete